MGMGINNHYLHGILRAGEGAVWTHSANPVDKEIIKINKIGLNVRDVEI
jgi:hypothetical protein